jgi:AraC-like DNA-binding protein
MGFRRISMLPSIKGSSETKRAHSLGEFAKIAERWSYGYDMGLGTGHSASPALAEGTLTTTEFASGIRSCVSDLVSLQEGERIGVISDTMIIVLLLEGDAADYALEAGPRMSLQPGSAVTITAAGQARLYGRYHRGERARSLVLQARAGDLADEELAEYVDSMSRTTGMRSQLINERTHRLARNLFTPQHDGLVGRLLAESCSLELLATSVAAGRDDAVSPGRGATIRPKDTVRVLRIRDKLLEELDRDHRLVDLARLAGMSVSALKMKFPAIMGQSVAAFLRDQRLERARTGLEREGWTVSQAAYFVGYRHPSNFATAYRRRFGVPPKDAWRQ